MSVGKPAKGKGAEVAAAIEAMVPADLGGLTRHLKMKDKDGVDWYVPAARETYSPPAEPDAFNDFTWSGLTFKTAYLSDGPLQNFNTYGPGNSCSVIVRPSVQFEGTSVDGTRFKKADLGELILDVNYIITTPPPGWIPGEDIFVSGPLVNQWPQAWQIGPYICLIDEDTKFGEKKENHFAECDGVMLEYPYIKAEKLKVDNG